MAITFFQIWVFLSAGLAFLLVLAWMAARNRERRLQPNHWWFLPGFVVLGGFALFTVRNYIFPDRSIFDNTRYHILEHLGFEFDSSLALVQARYPDASLWDAKSKDSAEIIVSRSASQVQIDLHHFYEPFYAGPFHHCFVLENNVIGADISKGLTLKRDGMLIFEMKILRHPHSTDSSTYLIRTDGGEGFDTSTFSQSIAKGYPLSDIVLKTPRIRLSDDLRILLEGALLVRDSILIEDTALATEAAEQNKSPLRFFPARSFYSFSGITVNGLEDYDQDKAFRVIGQNNSLFYSGVGFSATDILKIVMDGNRLVKLMYILPKMRPLRDESEGNLLFITSSSEEVKYHQLKGGYLFNIFESDKNLNHVNATVRYHSGSSTDAMFYKVKDLYATSQPQEIFGADTTIALQTQNRSNHLHWLFRFHNLRETNSLRLKNIDTFILIFLLLIVARLYVDTRRVSIPFRWGRPLIHVDHIPRIAPLELAIYVVIFCLSIVRLILAWRMSTFVPIEDIDASRFYKLRDGHSIYRWTQLMVIILFALITGIKLILNTPELVNQLSAGWAGIRSRSRSRLIKFSQPLVAGLDRPGSNTLLVIFFLLILSLLVLSKVLSGTFARLLNIPLPVVAYFIFDYYLLKAEAGRDAPDVTPTHFRRIYRYIYQHYARITLWLIAFAYLALQDSGFSIIFLLYGIIHHLLSKFFFTTGGRGWKWTAWIRILFIVGAFYCFLYWESELILSAFDHTLIWVVVLAIVLFSAAYLIGTNPFFIAKIPGMKLSLRHAAAFCFCAFALILLLIPGKLSDKLNKDKSYVKYRAEIQLPNVGIEDLIENKRFQSSDITYILRSAHNQWFINLYNSHPPDRYFTLQPHFNQGSSYTTQTTDLVVTRYLLAEHPVMVIIMLMLFFLSLPVIYSLDLNLKDSKINFSFLGVTILLYSIALFVFLAATNRVVFFGQDFPFLSLTSRIAVAFPLLIFLIAIFNSWGQQRSGNRYGDFGIKEKMLFLLTVLVMTVTCTVLIPSKNKKKNENHFNITPLIERTALKMQAINDEFTAYQYSSPEKLRGAGIDSLFSRYIGDKARSEKFNAAMEDPNDAFLSSLLTRFSDPLTNKWDPNELIHIRKNGTFYHLAVNRKYYFIPSFKEGDDQWQGSLLAAGTDDKFGFVNRSKHLFAPETGDGNNILHSPDIPMSRDVPELVKYRDQLNNIDIMKLDPSWTAHATPLYLIRSDAGDYLPNKASFHLFNDSVTIHGSSKYPAIRLVAGDLLELDVNDGGGNKTVIKWNVVEEKDKYLARNLWLNGSQTLFYPLGDKFIWSYNFANLVSRAWSGPAKSQYRHRDFKISIDYDLTNRLYDIIDGENKTKLDIGEAVRNRIIDFRNRSLEEKRKPNAGADLYLKDRTVEMGRRSAYRNNADMQAAVAYINLHFHPANRDDYNNELNKLIDEVTEKTFDYSAVVLDGYGRIRTLFDYSRYMKTDPNKIKDFNRFMSDLYKESTVSTEKEFFGNRALMTINPGPGSSFKPIAFTAAASKMNLGWEGLEIERSSVDPAFRKIVRKGKEEKAIAFYGGKIFQDDQHPELREPYWMLDEYADGLTGSTYLIHSNNVFHSLVILLGSQSEATLKAIRNEHFDVLFKDITGNRHRDSLTFPVINYKKHTLILDPGKWLQESDYFGNKNSVLASGLEENFRLSETNLEMSDTPYFNAFGQDSLFSQLFHSGLSSSFIWSYPEQSGFNQLDRTVKPLIRNGLIQPTLGSFPIKVTPLNMATMGMRLATLNREEHLTTLAPDSATRPYEFFNLDPESWDTTHFLDFYKNYVFNQLHEVIEQGTALLLKTPLAKYSKQGYYFYAKTGTINIEGGYKERGKHLMVIVTRVKLNDPHTSLTIDQLRHLRYYVIYMSYHGIDIGDFQDENNDDTRFNQFIFSNYGRVISAVMDSELFTKYMKEGK